MYSIVKYMIIYYSIYVREIGYVLCKKSVYFKMDEIVILWIFNWNFYIV